MDESPSTVALELWVVVDFPLDSPRTWPIFSGYRPMCWWPGECFNDSRHYHDATLRFNGEAIERGMSTEASLVVLAPRYWANVRVGTVIELSEGPIVVATATVISVRPR